MADINICKFCNSAKDKEVFIDNCSADDFSSLVSECQRDRANSEQESATIDNVEPNLDRMGIIRWLLQNTPYVNINFWDLQNIVEECTKCNNEEKILRYLKHYGVIIKSETYYDENEQYNALLKAAKWGTPDIISWLIEHGASTGCLNKKCKVPAQSAVKHGKLKNLIRLINLGADVNYDLLQIASTYNHLHIIKWIFENNLSTCPNTRVEALRPALEGKFYDIVAWLVDNNVSVTMRICGKTSAIHYAATTGNIVLIKWLLKQGATLLIKDENRKTVVHYAAENGHLNLLQWLLLQGGDIYERICFGFTPLHLAASKGHLQCVQFLVHNGCEVNSKDRNGKTVLHVAAESKSLEVVQFLVQHSADINAVDDARNTILHSAISSLDMLKWLVQIGCDPHKKNNANDSILSSAAHLFLYDTVKWLLEIGVNVIDMLETSHTWLRQSNEVSDWKLLLLCLKYVTDINVAINGGTLLHFAAQYLDAVTYLVANKANVNTVDSELDTPLHCALRWNSLKSANYLLDNGANTNFVNREGDSALHIAASCCNLNITRRILELVADVNLKNNKGESPLQKSVALNEVEIIKTIIDAGADVNSRNERNESVLKTASDHGRWNTVKLLIENGADINTHRYILVQAVSTEDIELVKWLLQHGANISNVLVDGEVSVLPGCSYIQDENKKLTFIKLFVERGADINGKNDYGQTILHNSIHNTKVVDYLIENGINVNIQSGNGQSALHMTIQRYCYNSGDQHVLQRLTVVQKLLKAGANVNAKDHKGRTPLFYAVQDDMMDVSKMLILYNADINTKDNEGLSIIHATSNGEIGLFLYENGANINARDISGISVLQSAIRKMPSTGTDAINIAIFLANRQVNTADTNLTLSNISQSISAFRYLKYIEFLIDNVKDINESDNNGRSALFYAVEGGNLPIFLKLIEKGVNVFCVTKKEENILHIAATKSHVHIAKYIVDNLDVKSLMKLNQNSENPLHLAVLCNSTDIVRILVNKVDINCKTDKNLTALHLACETGNLDIVKLVLSKGANIHEAGELNYTPIQFSAKHCKLQVLEYLVEYSGSENILDTKTGTNETLLHIAVKFGKFNNVPNKIVEYLLEKNICKIDTTDDKGNTPLHYACGTFMVDIITMLVEKGANINLKNSDGNTPFHIAARTGSIDVINYLLEKGGNISLKNKRGNAPIHFAASHAKINPVECLLERGSDLYSKNRKGVCLIHQLAIAGGTHLFKYLLDNFENTDVNVKNNRKQTPLALAMKFPTNKNVDVLLQKENINFQDLHGNTALHEACRFKNINFVDKLLQHDADVNIQNNEGDTPIHLAAKYLGPFSIEKLVPHFLDFNIINKYGWNILHSAASGVNIGVMQMLMLNLMDKFTKTKSGDTILHIASRNKDNTVFQWLVQNGNELLNECNNKGETVLHSCVKLAFHGVNILELLLANNADINAVNSNGDNVLHLAVNYGRIDFVNYFVLEKELDVTTTNNMGNIALHIACENGYLDIAKVLISFGSDVNSVNSLGHTCLHFAAKYGHMSVIKYLVNDKNCDVNIIDVEGQTALNLAMEHEQDIVVKWFLSRDV